jgi:hypothetical protein
MNEKCMELGEASKVLIEASVDGLVITAPPLIVALKMYMSVWEIERMH